MILLQVIALTFTSLCVILVSKKKTIGWALGIIGIIAFLTLYFHQRLYFAIIINLIFLVQSIYGWYSWYKGEDGKELPITKVGYKASNYIITTISLSFIFGILLKEYTDASSPFLDSFAGCFSFLANYWLIKKYLEAWLMWTFVNIVLIGLFFSQGLYIVGFLEIILLVVSFTTYRRWRLDLFK